MISLNASPGRQENAPSTTPTEQLRTANQGTAHAMQGTMGDAVARVEQATVNKFNELSEDGITAAELAEFKLAMDDMTSGMDIYTAMMKAYHDSSMSMIRNLA